MREKLAERTAPLNGFQGRRDPPNTRHTSKPVSGNEEAGHIDRCRATAVLAPIFYPNQMAFSSEKTTPEKVLKMRCRKEGSYWLVYVATDA